MGVIKKKTAVRGNDGGVKYVCDVCSVDITSTVRIRCANAICNEFDLCVPCFAQGKTARDHDPRTHSYQVIEQHSIPIFTEDWGADEELALIEGAETYGLGSWADIADHIGGFRNKDEVRDHYISTYIESSKFPLPEHASPDDTKLSDECPREVFQARKKRRIEDRREAAKNAPPTTPKQKPTASVPSCHDIAGYMPGRLEFEQEYFNEAEEAVQHMHFDPGDVTNPATGEMDSEMELKMTVMEIYNSKLTARVERKKIIFEHDLLEYRKHAAQDKKRTKEERDLLNKAKPFARMMPKKDFQEFCEGLEHEYQLRQAIVQLQEWRQMQIGDLKTGDRYETEKAQRAAQAAKNPYGALDRNPSSRLPKPAPPVESNAAALVAPELPLRLQLGLQTPPHSVSPTDRVMNGATTDGTNGALTPQNANKLQPPFVPTPLPNTMPLKLTNGSAPDLHLLNTAEQDLCKNLRLQPKAYMAIKEAILREAIKRDNGGYLKKKDVKVIAKIDATKGGKIFDAFVAWGWLGKG